MSAKHIPQTPVTAVEMFIAKSWQAISSNRADHWQSLFMFFMGAAHFADLNISDAASKVMLIDASDLAQARAELCDDR